jgi:hypothetical protein
MCTDITNHRVRLLTGTKKEALALNFNSSKNRTLKVDKFLILATEKAIDPGIEFQALFGITRTT